ncbi:MAG: type I DNA topoisomerase [Chloroflexota bacterium]|nr:type I DNA topoisomerase [Chloroflexota bacterium]
MTEELKLEAYCVKCRAKQQMVEVAPVFTKRAQPATRGKCAVCGTNVFRMGRTKLHEGMTPPPKPAPPPPTGKMIIVESPTKARTVGRMMGKEYDVQASVGHVRDLLRSKLSVDVEHDFEPRYRIPNEKRKVVKKLRAKAQQCSDIYLATDPDREGEAIAWHLGQVLQVEPERLHRVVFHEITEEAVQKAFEQPHGLDMNLVDAQQARRILDRLVGYQLSPLLWRKIRSRLSAGRVQSIALRLIVEREREINAFEPVEYWSLEAELQPQQPLAGKRPLFTAELARIRGEKVELRSETEVQLILDELAEAEYVVSKIRNGKRRRQPAAPYTTSTMQQEAARKLHFSARKSMRIAQQLYEGLDLGDGKPEGLITYMRTDSTNVAKSAQQQARDYIAEHYGAKFLPAQPPKYVTKAKGAQEAHEAIRPTVVLHSPTAIKKYLSRDQHRLYDLIWRRFVASQMNPALYDTRRAEILAGQDAEQPYLFRAAGSTLRFPGFLVVYEEKTQTDDNGGKQPKKRSLPVPPLPVGALLDLVRLLPEQHFTQPPPRYSDASLIQTMEKHGIGRPSTYASIISTVQRRGYVKRERRRMVPTDIGELVNDILVKHFPELITVDFTAQLERELDEIAEGQRAWPTLLHEFYGPFEKALEKADQAIPKMRQKEYVGRDCPQCGEPLLVKWGRYGKFIGCSNFPACRHTEPWVEKLGVHCPQCETGEIVIRRTKKRRRVFYGCSNWPECEFTSWKKPLPQPCPHCGGLLVEARRGVAECTVCGETVALEKLPVLEKETA